MDRAWRFSYANVLPSFIPFIVYSLLLWDRLALISIISPNRVVTGSYNTKTPLVQDIR